MVLVQLLVRLMGEEEVEKGLENSARETAEQNVYCLYDIFSIRFTFFLLSIRGTVKIFED